MSERKQDASLLPLLLAVSAAGVGLVLLGAVFFSRYVSQQMSQAAPHIGSPRDVATVETMFRAGLYPTALRVPDPEAKVAVELPANGSFQVATSEYVTHDEMEVVIAFYRHNYSIEQKARPGSSYNETPEPGGMRWTMKEGSTYRIVSLKNIGERTHIRLIWIEEDQP